MRGTTDRLTSQNAGPPYLSIMVEMTGIRTQHVHPEIVIGEAVSPRNPLAPTLKKKKARFHLSIVQQMRLPSPERNLLQ